MVCVTEEEAVCFVQLLTTDKICISKATIIVRPHNDVQYLIQEICREFSLKEHSHEIYFKKPIEGVVVTISLSESKETLLKDVGVQFDKTVVNSFIVDEKVDQEEVQTDGCNGIYVPNIDTDNLYRENDDLLLGASASPTTTEGSQNLTQGSVELLISSKLLRSDAQETIPYTIPYVGLVNQAMTCYLNSLLQALYMTPEFRNALYNWVFDGCDPAKSIPYQLQKLFLNLQTSSKSAVETTELTRSFGWDLSEAWQQHDIQELCRVMFDALEQKFKDTEQADLINRLYQGKMIDYVKCLECGTEKQRLDTFLDIPLPLRPFSSTVAYGSVEEALRAFVQPETLDGNNQYHCEKCNKKCDAHKGLKFTHIPYLLTLHLKRFDFDYTTMHRIKLNDKVTFPETLDLHSFIASETPDEPDPATEESVGIKCDDSSTTDSGSALDDEGCQGTEMTLSNTSILTHANHAPGNCDDDDEGIDVGENEKNRRHGAKGKYMYELFSIMIHSGSASGGHYYAYIKDFKKNQWFCFDDQTVSSITIEDIYKTYGGGPLRSYYSGAYSSSTNAYMLMYRQIDPVRNVQAMTVEEFPPHIQELLESLRLREESDRLTREREKKMCKLKVYVKHPSQSQMMDVKLYLHIESTYAEAVEEAYRKAKLDGIVPIEQCRLVCYNHLQESIECSFEDREEEQIGDLISNLKYISKTDWLLEIRRKDEQFMEYKLGGINFKVFVVNLETEDVTGPFIVRGYEPQTCKEYKAQIAKMLNLNEKTMEVAIKSFMNGTAGPSVIVNDDDDLIRQASLSNVCKIYVANYLDDNSDKSLFASKFYKIIDKFMHIISLDVVLPANDKLKLEVLSIPSLDLNQNSEKSEHSDLNGTTCTSTSPKLARVSPVLGAANQQQSQQPTQNLQQPTQNQQQPTQQPQSNIQLIPPLPPLDSTITEAEDSTAPSGGHSDQSNSEDSSLSDSDRTLVGDAPDECLVLSSTSNSPAASDQHLSSPEEPHSVFMDEDWDEVMEPQPTYFKATEVPTDSNENNDRILKVLIDRRTNLCKLKKYLEPYVGVPVDFFKVYRIYSAQEIECARPTETLSLSRDGEKLIVKLGRVLKNNEYAGKVYQLIPNGTEPIRLLFEWVIAKGMTVAQAKKDILNALKKQYNIEIPFDRCRLRKKDWVSPNVVYLDNQKFVDDIPIWANWEIFVQELSGPEPVTNAKQTIIFVRQWCPSTMELKPFQEVVLDTIYVSELKEKLSEISDIPIENIEIALFSNFFPCEASVLTIHTELEWNSTTATLDSWPFNCNETNCFAFRDNREQLKQLTMKERRDIRKKESSKTEQRLGKSSMYSPRKERALKIYLDSSPKKTDYPEVD